MITVSIMLATIIQALDTTIANVALPHMQGSLQASQDQITWVLTSYIVAAAITLPLTGWFCEVWGRRRVFIVSVVGFTVASALCGMASSLWQIVLARLLQGVFGAALVPLSQAVLLDINPREKVGQAMAVWGAGIMVGPILGPMLGGWLTENFNWRLVFYINLPVGLIALWGIVRYLPESRPQNQKLDVFGFVSLSLAIGLLQLFLDRGELLDWFSSWEIKLEAAGALVAFAFFAVHTLTVQGVSFFNRELLQDRNFLIGILFAFVVGIILYGVMALLPSFLQSLMGYPVVLTGVITAPRGLGTMLAMILVSRLVNRLDLRTIMLGGFALMAGSLYEMMQFNLDMSTTQLVVSGFVQGMGIGFTFVPLSAVTFATLAPTLRNAGTPIYSLLRNLGGSVGISIVTALQSQGAARSHSILGESLSLSNPALLNLPTNMPIDAPTTLAWLNLELTRQANMVSYLQVFSTMLLLTLGAMPFLLMIRTHTNTSTTVTEPAH
jgi:DHA2 family multidrug resistance protein